MSEVIHIAPHALRRNLSATRAQLAGQEQTVDTSCLLDPETAAARSLYYRACELILASYESGVIEAGEALTELQDYRLAWLEDGYTMRQLVMNEICIKSGLEPREAAKWQR